MPARVLAGDKKCLNLDLGKLNLRSQLKKYFFSNGGCTYVIVIATVRSFISKACSKAQKIKEITSITSLGITELSAGYVLPSSGNYLHSSTPSLG